MSRARLAILALLALAPAGTSGPTAASGPAAPADCSAAEHHQFDFWIGEWTVNVAGKPAGVNRIESAMKGCAIVEHWTSARGGRGTSLNFYDRATKQWSQAWMDEGGNALHLRGGLVDGRMLMSSAPRDGQGGRLQRITWSKNTDGTIRQVWESSIDAGKRWTVAFDGTYTVKR